MPVAGSTSGRINEEFLLLLFLHVNREDSSLGGELPEESTQFRFIRAACLANLKGSIGLMVVTDGSNNLLFPLIYLLRHSFRYHVLFGLVLQRLF